MTSVRVRAESHVYRPDGPHSFFADLIRARVLHEAGEAEDRLRRHQREVTMERRVTDAMSSRQWDEAATSLGLEARTNPTSALGSGGEFDVPAWMIDRYASASRAGRPLADLIGPLPLPAGISSVHIPRMSVGSLTGIDADAAGVAEQDITTVDASSAVVTIAGNVDVSQQLMDLTPGGFDAIAYTDLTRAYNRNLESQLLAGSGLNGQLLGLLNVSNITTINGTTGTTVTLFWPFFGQAAAGVGNTRLLPPEIWLMAPRRWFFIAASLDNSNRPLTSPGAGGPHRSDYPQAGHADPVGPILGLPVYMDGAIPAGATTDSAICCRPTDMFLFEGQPRVFAAPNPLSGTLQIRLSLHRYVAFIGNRYPSGIGVVTALPAPSNF